MSLKVFNSYSEKKINKIKKKYIKKINNLEDSYSKLNDEELKSKTIEFKNRLNNGEDLSSLLIEAFAVVREASKRVLGLRHFDVQLIGGCVLYEGNIAEMKTGEGKTLVATLPTYLNALTKKGVHVVTVNDYLAQRDRDTLKPLYDFLGVTCEVITSSTPKELRKERYNADILYITNNELGFDYLRDNMVKDINDKVQRELNYVIVDEVDSILIDEARTPLIIASPSEKANHLYSIVDVFIKSLNTDEYEFDSERRNVTLTEKGILKAETIFGLKNYSDIEHDLIRHHIAQGLKAVHHMKKDKNYIVKNNEIILIDEFTGRLANGRRYSNGLHQAIEAKEGVSIQTESLTHATITYQNFFKLYNKLSGMTGTAETEVEEFISTFNVNVIVIPTNLPVIRKDKLDKIYMSESAKYKAIIKDISRNYKKGRPVLVGTPTIEKSEILSELLLRENIPHQVLNAKYHDIEAEIVKRAGGKSAITIATNMAGRGTDIKLTDEIRKLGGLKVIGTEKAENRRVDNQLKGRSGRQGDPGVSQFYLSFEDDLVRFASDKYKELLSTANKNDERQIKNKLLNKIIDKCQKKIESQHFSIRKSTIEYDNIVNKQREIVYSQRDTILKSTDIIPHLSHISKIVFDRLVNNSLEEDNLINRSKLKNELKPFFDLSMIDIVNVEDKDISSFLSEKVINIIHYRLNTINDFDLKFKSVFIDNIDKEWIINIEVLEELKRDVKFSAFKGENPIQVYSMKSYEYFNEMVYTVQFNTLKEILSSTNLIIIDGVEYI